MSDERPDSTDIAHITVIVDLDNGTRFTLDREWAVATRLGNKPEIMPIDQFHRLCFTELLSRKAAP